MKLENGEMHLLRLIQKDADANGWAPVSQIVWSMVARLPRELVETEKQEIGGRVRLTDIGKTILDWI